MKAFTRDVGRSLLRTSFPQPLIFTPEPLDFTLISIGLNRLLLVAPLLCHEVIADQGAGDESNRTAD